MNVAPISFCNKLAFNVRDEIYKTNLLKEIFDKYGIIVTDNSCQIYNKKYSNLITKSKYLLSTNEYKRGSPNSSKSTSPSSSKILGNL